MVPNKWKFGRLYIQNSVSASDLKLSVTLNKLLCGITFVGMV